MENMGESTEESVDDNKKYLRYEEIGLPLVKEQFAT